MPWSSLYPLLREAGADAWAEQLTGQIARAMSEQAHGELSRWQNVIRGLPTPARGGGEFVDQARIGSDTDLTPAERQALEQRLRQLSPWRKGPYDLFGIHIDTEWRSDWKWDRLKPHIAPLTYKRVLDVGCGNGYHCWRMLGAGAKLVIGVDIYLLNVMQFLAVKKLHGPAPVYVLPLGVEQLPPDLKIFDAAFSMGVLYHRRSPLDHLLELKSCLRPGGELILETLIVDGDESTVLIPKERYAQMRNVWFIPSAAMLLLWLQRLGFKNARVVNVCATSVEEQRTTAWMPYNSLNDFLDPENPALTVEKYPAPLRAIFIANAP